MPCGNKGLTVFISGSRHQHVVHLIVWFTSLSAGFVIFFRHHFTAQPLIWTIPVLVPMCVACGWLYWDIIKADIVYFSTKTAQGVKGFVVSKGKLQLTEETKRENDIEKGLPQEPSNAAVALSIPPDLSVFPHEDEERGSLRRRVSTASEDSISSSSSSQANWRGPRHGPAQDPFVDGSSSEAESANEALRPSAPLSVQQRGKKQSLQARRGEAASRRKSKCLSITVPSPAISRYRSRDTYSGSESEPESPFTSSPLRDRHASERLAAEAHREIESMPSLPRSLRSATSIPFVQVPSPTKSRFSPSEPSSPTKAGAQVPRSFLANSTLPSGKQKTLSSASSRDSLQSSDAPLSSSGARPTLHRQGASTMSKDSSQTLVAAPERGFQPGVPSLKKPQLRERTSSLTLVDGGNDLGFAKEKPTLSPRAQVPCYTDLKADQTTQGKESLMDVKEEDEGGHTRPIFVAAALRGNVPVA